MSGGWTPHERNARGGDPFGCGAVAVAIGGVVMVIGLGTILWSLWP
jgi:hypothetical protein